MSVSISDADDPAVLANVQAQSKVIAYAIDRHTFPPSLVPARRSDKAAKIALFVHQLSLEVPDRFALQT
eukprot:1951925-Alexandrium_andersonii.AAC.1